MHEIELKFQLPPARRAAVLRAVKSAETASTRLRARYFDTPDRRLAKAGVALRLRQENDAWVQTLKARGEGALSRLEHEVALGPQAGTPQLDIGRHAGTPAGAALAAALGKQAAALHVIFETDVLRIHRLVRSGGAAVELALDIGELQAGAARQPLHELEFELKQGPVQGLIELAARWVERHALWLDVRSKSERGDRLARAEACGAAVHAQAPRLQAGIGAAAALRAMVGAGLAQILPNAAELAAETGGPEHLHQLRVGLRRSRTALRLFGAASQRVDPAWEPALAALARRLGVVRDLQLRAQSLEPALQAAGAPPPEAPQPGPPDDVPQALRAADANRLLLALMQFSHEAEPDEAGQASLKALARERIKQLHKRMKRDAGQFAALDDAARHRTRKRLKRLRYGIEFVAALFPDKAVQRYLQRLRRAQDALGRYTDLALAEASFRQTPQTDAHGWFAAGWLAAQRPPLLDGAARALQALAKAPHFWRRR
jgi:triphosphatase